MKRIEIALPDRSYEVVIGADLLTRPEHWLDGVPKAPLVVISNEVVADLYLKPLLEHFNDRTVHHLVFPDGEQEKSFENFQKAIMFLASRGIQRDACLMALGGGVVGDLCGFVAATWMRGIDFVQIPTTLLAQVDASVGGKTAINIPAGKNLVGAFHQPKLVVADISTLMTLPEREYRAGLAEVVKYGAIRDQAFLHRLNEASELLMDRDLEVLEEVVARSVAYKAEVVANDERESGVRAILNFGHTFGHAIEAATHYTTWLHGEAVSMGMVTAANLSESRGLCPPGVALGLEQLLRRLGLPVTIPEELETDRLLELMQLDKKNQSGAQRLVLLRDAGDAFVDQQSSPEAIRAAIDASR